MKLSNQFISVIEKSLSMVIFTNTFFQQLERLIIFDIAMFNIVILNVVTIVILNVVTIVIFTFQPRPLQSVGEKAKIARIWSSLDRRSPFTRIIAIANVTMLQCYNVTMLQCFNVTIFHTARDRFIML